MQTGHAQAFGQHPVLRVDHIVVIIARERHPHPVAGLAAFAVADIVGQDHVPFADVEHLARAIEFIGKLRAKELRAAPAGAVQDHHRIVDFAICPAVRRAERGDMDPQIHDLAGAKAKLLERHILFSAAFGPVLGGMKRGGEQQGEQDQDEFAHEG